MNGLQAFAWPISESAVERLGWVLIHSLWQLSLIALLAGLAARALRRRSAAARYGVLTFALAISVAAPAATWLTQPGDVPNRRAEPRIVEVQTKQHGIFPDEIPKHVSVAEIGDPVPVRPDSIGAAEAQPDASPPIRSIVQATPAWPERAVAALEPWLGWIVAGWCVGIFVFSFRPLFGWHQLRRLRRVGVSLAPDAVCAALERVANRLGVRRAVRVVQSTLTQVPVVVGYLRPMILLPVSLVANVPAAQLEAILAHELAHVRRHDFLINLLQILVETTFFYHPAVWWLSRRIRIEREHCCDDLVVALLSDPVEYGRALVAIEQMRGQSTVFALGAADGSLLARVRRILGVPSADNSASLRSRGPAALFALALIGLTFAVVMNWSLARDDDKATDPTSAEPKQACPKDDPALEVDRKPEGITIHGRVLDADGKALPGADVAVIGRIDGPRYYPHPVPRPSFADGKTDNEGRFRFELPARTSDYIEVNVAAISVGSALCCRRLEIDAWQGEVELRLQPEDSGRGRLVDSKGMPVAGARVEVSDRWNTAVLSDSPTGSGAVAAFAHGLYSKRFNPERKLAKWRVSASTDAQGRFALRGLKAGWRVALKVVDDRFGPHEFIVAPAEENKEFVGVLAPKRMLEGTVTSAENGKPVPNAELEVSTSSGEYGRDPTNTLEVRADERGRYSVALMKGERVEVTAHAPAGSPFLSLGKTMTWPKSGTLMQEMNLALATGVVVRGTVTEAASGKPVLGAKIASSTNYRDHCLVEPRTSAADGKFEIAVLPGRGHLLINGPTADFLHQDFDDSEGSPKWHTYHDAVVPLNSKRQTAPQEVSAVLRRGVTLRGSVVGPQGQSVREGTLLCRSYLDHDADWNATHTKRVAHGRFSLPGCDPERISEVFFVDEKDRWAGIAKLSGKDAGKPIAVKLERCGSAKVRFLDEKGNPIPKLDAWAELVITPGANLYDSNLDADAFAKSKELVSEKACEPYTTCRRDTDSEGRVTFECLIPGATYQLGGQSATTHGALPFGSDFRVAPGQVLDLGDVQVKPRKKVAPPNAGAPGAANAEKVGDAKAAILVKGRIADAQGEPVAGAFVAIVGATTAKGHKEQTLAEGVADSAGRYELTLPGASPTTHRDVNVVARADKLAVAWQRVDLNSATSQIDLKLPAERRIQVRLTDLQGKPAANVAVEITTIATREDAGKARHGLNIFQMNPQPRNALPRLTSDAGGLLAVSGIPADCSVGLEVVGSERFARQPLWLNSGEPEERPANDGTYRPIMKDVPPDQIVTIALPPATIFEGVVLLGETGMPAAHSRIKIWATQQIPTGSMVSIDGQTDARGRFRLNPYAGVRFGITAYPPADTPYFPRRTDDLSRKPGDGSKKLEIRLPAAVLASGTVIDAGSGTPVVGASVQYLAKTENKHATQDVVTGSDNMQCTDDQGRYKITVPPGPGTLLVHAPAGTNYVLQEKAEGEIWGSKPGGVRYYAHAFQSIAPPVPDAKAAATSAFAADPIKLQPGAKVVAKLVDADGKAIEEAVVITRLRILPFASRFRDSSRQESGAAIEIRGLEKGKRYPVHFLDVKRRLGATALISADDPNPTITLKPCASAKYRLVKADGKPVAAGVYGSLSMVVTPGLPGYDLANPAALVADEGYVANFDPLNHGRDSMTDKNGAMFVRALIPGATYRYVDIDADKLIAAKEFVAESGVTHDLGAIVLRK